MSKSPINFGMMSGIAGIMSRQYSNMSDEQLRRQYDAYSRLGGGIMGGVGSFFGGQRNAMQAEIQRRQMLGDFGMPKPQLVLVVDQARHLLILIILLLQVTLV